MGIQCRCGRFLAGARPVVKAEGNGYAWHEFIAEVRGNCSRCGKDAQAAGGWWFSWDAWDWEDAHTLESATRDGDAA